MPTNRSTEVDAFMDALVHPLAPLVQSIRLDLLRAEPTLDERIKWNAPSFCVDGVDRVTFNLRPTDRIQLIFHRGAKTLPGAAPFRFEDPSGLLQPITPERGQVVLRDVAEVDARRVSLLRLVHDWMRA